MYQIGILGTGDISHSFMKAMEGIGNAGVCGLYGRNLKKTQEFAKQYGIAFCTSNEDELIGQKPDLIYIGLPNSMHYNSAIKALSAGISILIEKPIVSNVKELDHLIALSKKTNTKIIEITRTLSAPGLEIVRDYLPKLGPIRFVHMSFAKYSRKYDAYLRGEAPNVFTTEYSGGALYDLGVYGVHLALTLFGDPKRIHYDCVKLDSGVDAAGVLNLTYPEFLVSIQCGKNFERPYDLYLCGEKETITSLSPASTMTHISTLKSKEELFKEGEYDVFHYAIVDGLRMMDGDEEFYQARLAHSQKVLAVMCEARAQADIVFEADQ
ncbi:MAG: Gfo/Idh/MocA family oxidoreductase [Erysipelotrichaceae bacterium]|jgi:predicted dehydrogenase|nr:Gfo/Idh/MocA family oxidoreductase [Erysipelotrichaceae bacterium]